MQYKKMYEEAKKKATYWEAQYENQRELRIEAEATLEGFKLGNRNIEGKESIVVEENRWLKETLRLLVVDESKMKTLAKHLNDDMEKRQISIPDYMNRKDY